MGKAVLEVPPPPSVNAQRSRSRAGNIGIHSRKKRDTAALEMELLAAGVPKPIPGDRVHATAVIHFPDVGTPSERRRDEGNFRAPLEKALGDALCPHQTREEQRLKIPARPGHLSDDTPAHFTFGAVTFEPADGPLPIARVTLLWGEDLAEHLEREAAQLRATA